MSPVSPDLEGWFKIAGAFVAVAMAVLVPIRSWIVEDRRYRSEAREARAAAARSALGAVTGSSTLLADALAISSLADALNRVAGGLERLLDGEQQRDRDRLARAVDRLLGERGPDG